MQIRFTGNKTKQNRALRVGMRGQALIEFAIILILVVLVVAGGAELAITAYGSSKVSDAAKAGATEWGQMISHAQTTLKPESVTDFQTDVGLGDHDPATNLGITQPSCDAATNTYDDGLPANRYIYDKSSTATNKDNYLDGGKFIFLFNPMVIDALSCQGTDPTRGDRSRISILVSGYGKYGDIDYVPGLPKLNQAMYSMYQRACLKNNSYANCNDFDEILYIPPGKPCLSDIPTEEHCPTEVNNGETGFYFFGSNNKAAEGSFAYSNDIPSFRPTFQIECLGSPDGPYSSNFMSGCDSSTSSSDICWDSPTSAIACDLKIHVRYRSIFESFFTFGMAELTDADLDLLPFFFNPSKVGNGSNNVKGIAGSEIGPIGGTGNPTVKPFRDFRGCFEASNSDILPNIDFEFISCH